MIGFGAAVDAWALGCIVAEMFTGKPLLPGTSTIDQLDRVRRAAAAQPRAVAFQIGGIKIPLITYSASSVELCLIPDTFRAPILGNGEDNNNNKK